MYDQHEYMRAGRAAKILGVDYKMIVGLIIAGKIDGHKTVGRSGHHVWVALNADVKRLRRQIGGA